MVILAATMRTAGAQTLPVADDPRVAAVLQQRTINASGNGAVPIHYADIVSAFSREDLLDQVQAEYARMLKPGQKPEFVVQKTGPRTYAYKNRKHEHSEIHELFRGAAGTNRFEVEYYVSGERFFGKFQSVILVGVAPQDGAHSTYDVQVYAYPEAALPRFLARHLGLVERYFKSKTRDMERMATQICTRLCQPAAPAQVASR